MTKEQRDILMQSFRNGLRPISNVPLYEWLEKNVELPNIYNPAGKFNIDFYPYLKRPMEDLLNNDIKQINTAACTQGGKSLLQQLFVPYIILESPGPILMIHDTGDNAKKCAEERIIPLLKNNPDIKRLLDNHRFTARKSSIQLPHMAFRIDGPAESHVLGFTAKTILGDEVWQWEANNHRGILEKLENRQTAYNATRKILLTSQPDREGSEWHNECMKGLWYEYGFRCTHCNALQRYQWNEETKEGKEYGMIMDKTVRDENDIPDYDLKASSARLVCAHCFGDIHDTAETRRDLVMNGEYILIHKGKNSSIRTYSWPQYMNRSVTFKEIALKYLNAVSYKRATGLRDKHEIFTQQTLGRFVQVGYQVDVPKLMTEAYSSSEAWPEETIRFLTIDPQKDYLNWLIRAWSNKVNECRLIDWGTVIGFSEIEELIKKYNIHALCIGIDSGYETKNIYAESIQRGKVITLNSGKRLLAQWTCFKGDGGKSNLTPKKFYKHKLTENGKTIEIDKLYSPLTLVDPQFPVGSKFKPFRANLYAWSNYSIKTILTNLRDKRLPFNWKLNERANADYTSQMFSEELTSKGRFEPIPGRPNHIFDMECLQLVMALQSDCYHPSASEMNSISSSPELVA